MQKEHGITRSIAAMRHFGKELDGAIVAIGNAPTALFEVIRLMNEENIRPAAIIGTPVGFVGAAESKDLLIAESKGSIYYSNRNKRAVAQLLLLALMQ